ncbi:MAG: hypothetical protein AAB969_03940 [Patescibacteria group bacterium]
MGGQGIWYLTSKKDPRWNTEGSGFVSIYGSEDRDRNIEIFKKLYGDPPDDLVWGFVKT